MVESEQNLIDACQKIIIIFQNQLAELENCSKDIEVINTPAITQDTRDRANTCYEECQYEDAMALFQQIL